MGVLLHVVRYQPNVVRVSGYLQYAVKASLVTQLTSPHEPGTCIVAPWW